MHDLIRHLMGVVDVDAMANLVAELQGMLVHVSTDYVFDGESSRAYLPDDQRNPLSVYGNTKAEGEDVLRPTDLLVWTAWVYTACSATFVRTMLRLMRERDSLTVVADQIGAPTWAPGLAQAIWGLIAKGASGTFHYSVAGAASCYDFTVTIKEEALDIGLLDRAVPIYPIPTSSYPTTARRPAFSLLDCSKTLAVLDDQPTHWRVNLRRMLSEEKVLG
jgi:dTDP-4-dehydrorhamnose reductase